MQDSTLHLLSSVVLDAKPANVNLLSETYISNLYAKVISTNHI